MSALTELIESNASRVAGIYAETQERGEAFIATVYQLVNDHYGITPATTTWTVVGCDTPDVHITFSDSHKLGMQRDRGEITVDFTVRNANALGLFRLVATVADDDETICEHQLTFHRHDGYTAVIDDYVALLGVLRDYARATAA